jgi:hypothetical protein
MIVKGERKPGINVCHAIAKAFKIPPETVLRAAEILKDKSSEDKDFDALLFIYQQMTKAEREEFTAIGRLKVDMRKKQKSVGKPGTPTTESTLA